MKTAQLLVTAISVVLASAPVHAQHAGHGTTQPASPPAKTVKKSEPPASADKTSQSNTDHSKMDHSQMQGMDHSKMDHSQMQGMDHSKMDHSQMQRMDQSDGDLPANAVPREPIPAVTAAERAEAFPPVHEHHKHGTSIQNYSLIDRLEISRAGGKSEQAWEAIGWVGGDVQKFWWRTEGHAQSGSVERASVEALYGRGVRAWWDVVAGVRHDFGEGPGRTWVGVGVQGLAPYKFEVSATAYVGPQGRTALRAGAEYDSLITNRLILQWRLEGNAYGKDDPALRIGSGLSTIEAGMRLRYEINRQFAPYVGVEHDQAFGDTARYRRASGHGAGDTKVLAGVRIWF